MNCHSLLTERNQYIQYSELPVKEDKQEAHD
jgi:hypothetical protein